MLFIVIYYSNFFVISGCLPDELSQMCVCAHSGRIILSNSNHCFGVKLIKCLVNTSLYILRRGNQSFSFI